MGQPFGREQTADVLCLFRGRTFPLPAGCHATEAYGRQLCRLYRCAAKPAMPAEPAAEQTAAVCICQRPHSAGHHQD